MDTAHGTPADFAANASAFAPPPSMNHARVQTLMDLEVLEFAILLDFVCLNLLSR